MLLLSFIELELNGSVGGGVGWMGCRRRRRRSFLSLFLFFSFFLSFFFFSLSSLSNGIVPLLPDYGKLIEPSV